ncbi:hypothetical protein ABZT43_28950, partial [Streptomyces sp. NPDC005349]|uniref:hypothetical protein n=1 Tax=Streptomyces sp. NPDC005349 TaxID=3157037 RepID=UPI0033AC06BC
MDSGMELAGVTLRERYTLQRRPGRRAWVLTINHTALDGPACLRVLATAAEIYGALVGSGFGHA